MMKIASSAVPGGMFFQLSAGVWLAPSQVFSRAIVAGVPLWAWIAGLVSSMSSTARFARCAAGSLGAGLAFAREEKALRTRPFAAALGWWAAAGAGGLALVAWLVVVVVVVLLLLVVGGV